MSGVLIVLRGKDEISKAVKSAGNSLDGLRKKAGSVVSKGLMPLKTALIGGVAAAATTAAAGIAGLVATIIKGTSEAADMEQAVADVAATMGLAAGETADVKKLIQDLGLDPKLKVTAVEAAQAIDMLGKNGLKMSDILGGAARNTVLLSNSTGGDFAQSADIATDVMSLFNIQAADMADAVNGITGVTKNSKFDINDYGLAIAQAGGVASTVGVDFADFNATIAAISPSFASGSDAGTSFKVMLQRLVPASDPAQAAMTNLGIITEEAGNRFFDAEGNMKSMGEIAGILSESLSGLSEEQKISALSTIFGTDAMRAAAAMAEIGEGAFNDLKTTIANTDAEASAATRMDTLRGVLEILGGVLETVRMQIGDQFIPIVRDMAERLTEFVSTHSDQIVGFFQQLAAWVAVAADKLFTGAEAIVAFVDQHGLSLETARYLWAQAKVKFSEFIDHLMDSVRARLPAFQAKMAEWGDYAWQWIKDAAARALAELGVWAVGLINEAIAHLPEWKRQLDAWALEAWRWILDALPEVLAQLGVWARGLFRALISYLPDLISTLKLWATETWQWIKDVTPDVVDQVKELAGNIINTVKERWPDWRANFLDWAKDSWQWIKDSVPAAITSIRNWAADLFQAVRDRLPEWRAKLSEWGQAAWSWITDAASHIREELGIWYGNVRDWFDENLPKFKAKVSAWGYELYDWISNSETTEKTKKAFDDWGEMTVAQKINELDAKLTVRFNDLMIRMFDWIAKSIPQTIDAMTDWLIALIQGTNPDRNPQANAELIESQKRVSEAFNRMLVAIGVSLGENAKRLGPALWQGFKDGLFGRNRDEAERAAEDASRGILNRIKSFWRISSPSQVMFNVGVDVMTGLRDGLKHLWNDLIVAADQLAHGALDTFNRLLSWDNFFSLGAHIMSGLRDGIRHMWYEVTQAVSEIAESVGERIRNLLGIHSPSKVMMALGEDTMRGYQLGLESLMPDISGAMEALRMDNGQGSIDNSVITTNTSNFYMNYAAVNAGDSMSAEARHEEIRRLRVLYGSR